MPAVLTHKTIMLLARERLSQIRDALQAKKNTSGAIHTDLEDQILELAKQACIIMSEPPHPTTTLPGEPFSSDTPYLRPLGQRISKFAVMGAMGPDITAFSALLSPGQAWLFDTVHKGNPDASREMVAASTCEFPIEFWRRVSTATADEVKRKNMRAYVLGHLCHLAADIISHPIINDIEWHQSTSARKRVSHSGGEGRHDAMVAKNVLLRKTTREGAAWDAWWPAVDDVPPEFFTAYADTLEAIYTARSRRRAGFGEFEERFEEFSPPALTADLIRDGYKVYRNGIVSIGYGYGTWNWVAFLLPLTIPMIALPIIAAALPHSKQLFRDSQPGDDNGKAWLEMFALPITAAGFAASFYGIWIGALTTKGVEGRSGVGISLSAIFFLLGIFAIATSSNADIPDWLKWLLGFGAPTVTAALYMILGIADVARAGYAFRSALSFIFGGMTVLFLLAGLLCVLVYRVCLSKASNRGLDSAEFWIATVLWSLAWFFGFSVVLSRYLLRDARIPEELKSYDDERHMARLFDDNGLYGEPTVPAPTLGQRFFPSERRKLLKLWWEGDGDMFVRSDRYQLVFNFTNTEGADKQVVPAPVGPMTLVEFSHMLENRVKDSGGIVGKLKAATVFNADIDYELPPGATFADHGDDQNTAAKHDEKAAEFRKLGTTQDGTDYILYHAPKPAQAIRFGELGPLNNPFGQDEEALHLEEGDHGYKYVFNPVTMGDDDTIMAYAADFAALLCLGGTSHMDAPATRPDAPRVNPIHQVFRNWCLDRRRENEWRMLVAGGASSEKAGHPETFDPLMLRPPSPDNYKAPLANASLAAVAEGERTAREMGWVPLLRKWIDLARRPSANPLADERLNPNNPTNRALTRGMAFLLDLPDPVALP